MLHWNNNWLSLLQFFFSQSRLLLILYNRFPLKKNTYIFFFSFCLSLTGLSVFFTLSQFTSPLSCYLGLTFLSNFLSLSPLVSSSLSLFLCIRRRRSGIRTFPISIKLYHHEVLWIMSVFEMSKECGSAPAALSWNLHPRPQSVRDQRDQAWERNQRILFKVRKHNMCIQGTCVQIEIERLQQGEMRDRKLQIWGFR